MFCMVWHFYSTDPRRLSYRRLMGMWHEVVRFHEKKGSANDESPENLKARQDANFQWAIDVLEHIK